MSSSGTTWHAYAACRDMPYDTFFPDAAEARTAINVARAVCVNCPVAEPCLSYALQEFGNRDDHGVWAGTTPRQRRLLRSVTTAAPQPPNKGQPKT